jgi:hypothetical protein
MEYLRSKLNLIREKKAEQAEEWFFDALVPNNPAQESKCRKRNGSQYWPATALAPK